MMAMNDIGMPWDVVFENFDKVMEAWSDNAEAADYLFIVLGGAAAFGTARQTGN
jgi:hypothetical protein